MANVSALIDGRLPTTVVPERYDLTLSVEPAGGTFSGFVAIHVEVRQAVRNITLHALELEIHEVTVEAGGIHFSARLSWDAETEAVTLELTRDIPPGPAMVGISFSGRLNKQMKGLYEATAGTERYAFTQFEATDARRAFPCFDEPGMKAVFRITAVIPDNLMALSNMGVEAESVEVAGTKVGGRRTITFAETPRMSTYLVALAVAKLSADSLLIDGTQVSFYATSDRMALTGFGREVMQACLPRLNEYFGLRYPIPKLDLVGVPDFAMGAMENWGAIFFRENRLLVDSAKASAGTLRAVANVITHEVVHQWFGNLVTMEWWDDLWLNESFATWLACKIVDDWRPEWQSWVEFVGEKQVPLGVDALVSTRPISSKVRTAAEVEEMFDALTYEKGASVLRMLEQFLGQETFRDGIRNYIAAHQYGNAPAADLWAALEAASGQPVSRIANDWFTKPGFPLVTVSATSKDFRSLQVEQGRFMADPDVPVPPGTPWAIPLTLSFKDDQGVRRHRILMTEAQTTIALPANGSVRWVYANAGEVGYYRTNYTPTLSAALAESVPELSPEERFGLLDNAWVMTKKGAMPIGDFLDLIARFRGDATRIVVEGIAGYLETLNDRMVIASLKPKLGQFVAHFMEPLVERLGWDPQPHEGDEPKMTRALVLWSLGSIAQPAPLLGDMAERLERYWSDASSIDPTLVAPVMRLCARTGDKKRFLRYVERYRVAATPEERDRYLTSFGDFAEPDLTKEILAFTLGEEVRGQDLWKPMRGLLANPATQATTWAFIQQNWQALREKGGTVGASRIIGGTRWLWGKEWLTEVETFFTRPENHVAPAERTLAQTLEFIRLGLAFRRAQQERFATWLQGWESQ